MACSYSKITRSNRSLAYHLGKVAPKRSNEPSWPLPFQQVSSAVLSRAWDCMELLPLKSLHHHTVPFRSNCRRMHRYGPTSHPIVLHSLLMRSCISIPSQTSVTANIQTTGGYRRVRANDRACAAVRSKAEHVIGGSTWPSQQTMLGPAIMNVSGRACQFLDGKPHGLRAFISWKADFALVARSCCKDIDWESCAVRDAALPKTS